MQIVSSDFYGATECLRRSGVARLSKTDADVHEKAVKPLVFKIDTVFPSLNTTFWQFEYNS